MNLPRKICLGVLFVCHGAFAAVPAGLEPNSDERYFCPGLILKLGWKSVAGATAYRVQVSQDIGFHSFALNLETTATHLPFIPKEAGTFVWRVASRDENQKWGEFSSVRPVFCEPEEPSDSLLMPEDQATFKDSKPLKFSWKPVGSSSSYRVVVSSTPDLHAADARVYPAETDHLEIENLPPGDYFWGVYSENVIWQPLFLQPRALSLKKLGQKRLKTPTQLKNWGQ